MTSSGARRSPVSNVAYSQRANQYVFVELRMLPNILRYEWVHVGDRHSYGETKRKIARQVCARSGKMQIYFATMECMGKVLIHLCDVWSLVFVDVYIYIIICPFNSGNVLNMFCLPFLNAKQGTVVNPVAAALCALIVYSEFLIHPMVLLSTSRRMRQEVLRSLKRHSPCCCWLPPDAPNLSTLNNQQRSPSSISGTRYTRPRKSSRHDVDVRRPRRTVIWQGTGRVTLEVFDSLQSFCID